MKRIGSFAVALVMLLSMLCSFAAVSAAPAEMYLELVAKHAEAGREDQIQFDLKLINHADWATVRVTGTYDNTLLENGVFDPVAGEVVAANVKEDGTFDIAWGNTHNLPAAVATLLGTFSFHIKKDAAVSTISAAVMAGMTVKLESAGAHVDGSNNPATVPVDTTVKEAETKVICAHDVSTTGIVKNNDGTHSGTCTICGATATEPCDFQVIGSTGATCLLTCTKCGATKKDVNGTHVEKEHYYAPTATVPGKIAMVCDCCGTESDVINLEAGYRFPDMKDTSAWYYDAGLFCASYGIIQGLDGNFSANTTVTRAQAATAFSRMLLDILGTSEAEINAMNANEFNLFVQTLSARFPTAGATVQLTDVDGTWYERNAKLLSALGIINGREGGVFDGNTNINRQEFALLSQRLIKLIEKIKKTTYGAGTFGTVTPSFADQALIPAWAAEGVEWARSTGLMGGSFGNFNPTNSATRAELATLMMRIKVAVDGIIVHL